MKKQPAVPMFLAVTIPHYLLSKVVEPLLSAGSRFILPGPKPLELNSEKFNRILNYIKSYILFFQIQPWIPFMGFTLIWSSFSFVSVSMFFHVPSIFLWNAAITQNWCWIEFCILFTVCKCYFPFVWFVMICPFFFFCFLISFFPSFFLLFLIVAITENW